MRKLKEKLPSKRVAENGALELNILDSVEMSEVNRGPAYINFGTESEMCVCVGHVNLGSHPNPTAKHQGQRSPNSIVARYSACDFIKNMEKIGHISSGACLTVL